MNAEQLATALLLGELKTLESIAKHIPRQDGSGIGVKSATAWQWIERGNLPLEQVLIDGARFFHVSADDQLHPDWGLQARFKKQAHRGRLSHKGLLGFVKR